MSKVSVDIILCRAGSMNNYAYLLVDEKTGKSAIVDPSEVTPIVKVLEAKGIELDYILNTHHHYDHTDGNIELQKITGAKIVGNKKDAARIPGINIEVEDEFLLGESKAKIIEIEGHTKGHIAFYFEESKDIFTGDVLFSLGCGGMFEGTPEEMCESLEKLSQLPDSVRVYPGHEYTMHCASFALYVDRDNQNLVNYVMEAKEKQQKGLPTIPSTIGKEKKCNPYMRVFDKEFRNKIGVANATSVEAFIGLLNS